MWVGRLDIITVFVLPKLISRCTTILIKSPPGEIDRLIPKCIWKHTGPGISQAILGQKQIGELKPSAFKSCETGVVQTVLPAGGQQEISGTKDRVQIQTLTEMCLTVHSCQGSPVGRRGCFQHMVLEELDLSIRTALSLTPHKQYFEMGHRFKSKN